MLRSTTQLLCFSKRNVKAKNDSTVLGDFPLPLAYCPCAPIFQCYIICMKYPSVCENRLFVTWGSFNKPSAHGEPMCNTLTCLGYLEDLIMMTVNNRNIHLSGSTKSLPTSLSTFQSPPSFQTYQRIWNQQRSISARHNARLGYKGIEAAASISLHSNRATLISSNSPH